MIPNPTATEAESLAFVDGVDHTGRRYGRVKVVKTLSAPKSPEAVFVRTWRQEQDMSMGELARRLGLTVPQVSGLERGTLVPEGEDGWAQLVAALREIEEG